MKTLILVAMDKEMTLLLNLIENLVYLNGDETIARGTIGDSTVFLAKCGIGKVNSAIIAYELITRFDPDLVINSGVAGGAGVPIGTLLVADKITYHDVWCGPGTEYGQADGCPRFMLPDKHIINVSHSFNDIHDLAFGLICSGDKFISSAEEIAFIRSNFPDVKAVDMESASIAQVCIKLNKEFAVIRVVSDTPGEGDNLSQYKDFWNQAPQKNFQFISRLLNEISDKKK